MPEQCERTPRNTGLRVGVRIGCGGRQTSRPVWNPRRDCGRNGRCSLRSRGFFALLRCGGAVELRANFASRIAGSDPNGIRMTRLQRANRWSPPGDGLHRADGCFGSRSERGPRRASAACPDTVLCFSCRHCQARQSRLLHPPSHGSVDPHPATDFHLCREVPP